MPHQHRMPARGVARKRHADFPPDIESLAAAIAERHFIVYIPPE